MVQTWPPTFFTTEQHACRSQSVAEHDEPQGSLAPDRIAFTSTPLVAISGRTSDPAVSVQVARGGIQGSPVNSRTRASMAGTPFLRVVDR